MNNDSQIYVSDSIDLTKEWSWDKNEKIGLCPDSVKLYSKKSAWWKCSACGHEWQAVVGNRYKGAGCPECGKIKRALSLRKTLTMERGNFAEKNPELLKEWDYEKNTISPFNITSGSKMQVWWKCFSGHSWKDTVVHRTVENRGCPTCSRESKTSFPEQAIYFYFKQVTNATNRESVNGKEIDIYLKDLHAGIEYNGRYWHENKKDYDLDKVDFFKNIGIRIISVTDGDKNKVENDCITYKKDLNFAITSLFDVLHVPPPSINIERDKYEIYEQYMQIKQENSLFVKYPKIAKEWHPVKNGNLTPDMFDYSSNKSAWWLCSQCGSEWEDTINHRTSKNTINVQNVL